MACPSDVLKRGERNKAYRLHVQRAHFATRSSNLRNLTNVYLALYYTDALAAVVSIRIGCLAGLCKDAERRWRYHQRCPPVNVIVSNERSDASSFRSLHSMLFQKTKKQKPIHSSHDPVCIETSNPTFLYHVFTNRQRSSVSPQDRS
jgi:hypothetical protein